MNKDLKSFMWSLAFILLYFYATTGIVKLFWNTKNEYVFSGRVKFLVYLHILITAIIVILPYHLSGPHYTDGIYRVVVIYHFLYVMVGLVVKGLSTDKI
jgi:hypothetical protein